MEIRPEADSDVDAIREVTRQAFSGRPYAGGDEQDVIDRLRRVGALELSLVAVEAGEVIGQVTFSLATNSDGTSPWHALGPVSVRPERQGEGVGAALIEAGLALIADGGSLGCILTGSPDYYRRFGFELAPSKVPAGEPAEYFMLKLMKGKQPAGRFSFHPAFYGEP